MTSAARGRHPTAAAVGATTQVTTAALPTTAAGTVRPVAAAIQAAEIQAGVQIRAAGIRLVEKVEEATPAPVQPWGPNARRS